MGQILNMLLHDNIDDLKKERAKLVSKLDLIDEAIKELEK